MHALNEFVSVCVFYHVFLTVFTYILQRDVSGIGFFELINIHGLWCISKCRIVCSSFLSTSRHLFFGIRNPFLHFSCSEHHHWNAFIMNKVWISTNIFFLSLLCAFFLCLFVRKTVRMHALNAKCNLLLIHSMSSLRTLSVICANFAFALPSNVTLVYIFLVS